MTEVLAPFKWAASGVARCLAVERHLKLHWLSGTAVMLVSSALDLDLGVRLLLWLFTAVVIAAELFNSALEQTVDAISKERSTWARNVKDAAAGAVLVLALFAAGSLAAVIAANWSHVRSSPEAVARTAIFGGPVLIAEALVLFRPLPTRVLLFAGALGAAGLGPLWARSFDSASVAWAAAFLLTATISRLLARAHPRTE